MSEIYIELIEYIFFGLSAVFLIISIVLFIRLRIPSVIRDLRGTVEEKQIESIRDSSSRAAKHSSAMNVFEELEQKAKPRMNNTKRIKMPGNTTADLQKDASAAANPGANTGADPGTAVLKTGTLDNADFRLEKNIIFVCTNDVLA